MAFAGHCGLEIDLPAGGGGALGQLFAEELGAVIQVRAGDEARVAALLAAHGCSAYAYRIGAPAFDGKDALRVRMRIRHLQL